MIVRTLFAFVIFLVTIPITKFMFHREITIQDLQVGGMFMLCGISIAFVLFTKKENK